MKKYFNSPIGLLRLIGFLEGTSLLLLLFVAMPVKYLLDNDKLVKHVGQSHGMLFLLFVVMVLFVAFKYKWSFGKSTWKALASSFIPFGTFYMDKVLFKPEHEKTINS
ncbi:MAG: DUF3817 domain-containing protein [Saprospiraceae bacterium]